MEHILENHLQINSFIVQIIDKYIQEKKNMSQSQIVQARINKEIKEEASAVLANFGLSISDIIRVVLTRVANEKAIPAALFTSNPETLHAIYEVETNKTHSASSLEEMFQKLNNDGE